MFSLLSAQWRWAYCKSESDSESESDVKNLVLCAECWVSGGGLIAKVG